MPKLIVLGDTMVNADQDLPERAEHDRYITPELECEQAYAMLMKWHPKWRFARPCESKTGGSRGPHILDPGAGPGIWGTVARRIWPSAVIHGIEIEQQPRPEAYDRYDIGRFPGDSNLSGYELIVGNPPYNQANVFVKESMRRLKDGGCLMFLLRLQYCTGIGRRNDLFHEYPIHLYAVYSRRISWRADGKRKTPPRDHALFIWKKGYSGPSYLDLIGKTADKSLADYLEARHF